MTEVTRIRRTNLERVIELIQKLTIEELRELPAHLEQIDPWILERISGKGL